MKQKNGFTLRLPEDIANYLEGVAADEERTVTAQIIWYIKQDMKKKNTPREPIPEAGQNKNGEQPAEPRGRAVGEY